MHDRPGRDEYPPYYAGYVAKVPAGDVRDLLRKQAADTIALLGSPAAVARAEFRYAPGKWSLKEVVGHITDAERVFSYRLLRFARADETPLAGYDEKLYTPAARCDERALSSLVNEFAAVRAATIALLEGLPDDAWLRWGTANNARFTVRAQGAIIAGHELHHRGIVEERHLAG